MSGGLGLRQLDEFYRMMNLAGNAPQAEDVVLSPAIQALVNRIEAEFGIRVILRPYQFFGRSNGAFDPDDNVMAIFVPPGSGDLETQHVILHELGHWKQQHTGPAFDRNTTDGYIDCELNADVQSRQAEIDWGLEFAFSDNDAEKKRRILEWMRLLMYDLAPIVGTYYAPLLSVAAINLLHGDDRLVGKQVRRLLADRGSAAHPLERLVELAWPNSQLLVQLDRSCLYPAWVIERTGRLPRPLRVEDEETAANWLLEMMEHPQALNGDNYPTRRLIDATPNEGQPTMVTLLKARDPLGIARFVSLVQALVMQDGDEPIILDWSIATSGSLAVYEAHFQWDEVDNPDDRPEWRIILLIPDKDSESVCYAVDALRMYINCYRRVANVRRAEIGEAIGSWMWWWRHDTGEDVDPRSLIRPPSAS